MKTTKIKIKKLYPNVTLPTKAHSSDACYDIYAYIPSKHGMITIPPQASVIIDTGFCTEIPEGYYCPVYARSGMGIKQNLRLANDVGIIDSSYRGEWKVAIYNDGTQAKVIEHNSRIAQFAILPVIPSELEEVEEVSITERGAGGFGSTGK